MEQSTLISKCPGCREQVRIERVQGGYRCLKCNFDYVSLAKDQGAREAWMLDNLTEGAMGRLMTLTIHRLVMQLSPQESKERILAFAAANGIDFPKGKSNSTLLLYLLGLFAVITVIALALVFLVGR